MSIEKAPSESARDKLLKAAAVLFIITVSVAPVLTLLLKERALQRRAFTTTSPRKLIW